MTTDPPDAAATDDPPALVHTGERTLPGIAEENYWFRRHEVVYLDLVEQCRGHVVLDAGSGEGYGAGMLSAVADRVLALDYDAAAISHTRRRYPRVAAARANLAALPVADAVVDVIVNSQVIEHLWDQDGFLAECRRILRPGGRLIVTTPNRLTFTPEGAPLNPFHTRELSASELTRLLEDAGLTVTRMAGTHHGPRLRELDARWGGSLIGAQLDHHLAGTPWPAGLAADVAAVAATDFEIRDGDIDDSLDLVAFARRENDAS